jgi:hypothetical protein
MKTDHEAPSYPINDATASPTPTPDSSQNATPRKPKAARRAKDTAKPIKGVKLPRQRKAGPSTSPLETDKEPIDRFPTTLEELQGTKGGFVASLFLTGKDEATIVKELKEAFNLTEAKSVAITRRIIRRTRLYQRIFRIMETQL